MNNAILLRYLATYCEVNALGPNWQGLLAQTLQSTRDVASAEEFKRQLRASIVNDGLMLSDFEAATHWGLETDEELKQWLIELWQSIYGDEGFDDNEGN